MILVLFKEHELPECVTRMRMAQRFDDCARWGFFYTTLGIKGRVRQLVAHKDWSPKKPSIAALSCRRVAGCAQDAEHLTECSGDAAPVFEKTRRPVGKSRETNRDQRWPRSFPKKLQDPGSDSWGLAAMPQSCPGC